MGETLIGPAQGMGRQDHIVQIEQRVVEGEGLDLEDVEAGAGDPSLT